MNLVNDSRSVDKNKLLSGSGIRQVATSCRICVAWCTFYVAGEAESLRGLWMSPQHTRIRLNALEPHRWTVNICTAYRIRQHIQWMLTV